MKNINKLGNIIYTHHDADGLVSAHLLHTVYPEKEIIVGKDFGYFKEKTAVMLDQVPISSDFEGLVIDHHLGHWKKRKYELIYRDYPASLIVHNLFIEKIPKKELWKVIIGLVGDCAVEYTPTYIWKKYPYLVLRIFSFSQFQLLASGFNSLFRLDRGNEAFEVIKEVESPREVLNHPVLQKARVKVRYAVNKSILRGKKISFGGFLELLIIESDYNIQGRIASKMYGDNNITSMCWNKISGSFSMRGVLTPLIGEELNKIGINVGGHKIAMGGFCEKDLSEKLILVFEQIKSESEDNDDK